MAIIATNSNRGPKGLRPTAFTLIEILLTLSLLVIMGALAWPQLEKTFTSLRLRKAADQIRTQWTKARVEAMSAGCIRVFRYEVAGNKYRIDALTTDIVALQTGAASGSAPADGTQILQTENTDPSQNNINLAGTPAATEKTLPKDIFFVASQTVVDTRAATAATNLPAAGNPSADAMSATGDMTTAGAGWSEPIFFYPDGTTSSARLWLRNNQGRMIELVMRGLTGIVKVGDVTAALPENL